MELNGNKIKQKLSKKYCCKKCNYNTDRKSNLENHLLSTKHILELNGNEIKQKLSTHHNCENCNKIYETSAGLWKHKKKCLKKEETNLIEHENNISPELILNIIQQNQEFKDLLLEQNKIMIEMSKNINTTNINNSMTNSNNKTFNLQVFLNETCKDAMNIMDFVDSIKLQLSDLENVGKLGYVEGISNIITTNLKALDVTQRPVHCTDKKRETLYIKDEDKWEKEDEEKTKIRKVIKKVATKNACLLPKFKEAHPDCVKSSSKFSDQYNKIIVESMGGSGDNNSEKEEKIIKKIAKEVLIEKEI